MPPECHCQCHTSSWHPDGERSEPLERRLRGLSLLSNVNSRPAERDFPRMRNQRARERVFNELEFFHHDTAGPYQARESIMNRFSIPSYPMESTHPVSARTRSEKKRSTRSGMLQESLFRDSRLAALISGEDPNENVGIKGDHGGPCRSRRPCLRPIALAGERDGLRRALRVRGARV